jgi:hypothetical protein
LNRFKVLDSAKTKSATSGSAEATSTTTTTTPSASKVDFENFGAMVAYLDTESAMIKRCVDMYEFRGFDPRKKRMITIKTILEQS